ncbi:MAG: response regulator [Nitrospira sp. BO4]|jgi:DNA-binding response OmpR family regulator|nr:response regulator [Nitrospira sp. BO4]
MVINRTTVLIVEGDREMRNLLYEEFWSAGYRLREAQNVNEAVQAVLETPPDVIVTDLKPSLGAAEYLSLLRSLAPQCPIIVMTAFGGAKVRAEVMQSGASAYFDKPVRLSDIRAKIEGLLFKSNHRRVCDANR